jgi:hypothetical protein
MTVYLGNAGNVELIRDSGDVMTGTVIAPDVNTNLGRFSFNFSSGTFITGDFVNFSSTSNLLFISGFTSQATGDFFVNVDQLGGLRLYLTYSDAVAGTSNGRVALVAPNIVAPATSISVNCKILNSVPRVLGQIVRFELSTDREAVDTTGLGDEFRNQYSTLITGSGSIECIFDYAVAGETEIAVYLHNLLLRQQFGSDFKAKLYILSEGQAQGVNSSNDSIWYEINGVMTNAAISCAAGDIIGSTFTFVTTGEIKLRVQTVTWGELLLRSSGDRLILKGTTLTGADNNLLLGEDL